jgi:hypothetical protein
MSDDLFMVIRRMRETQSLDVIDVENEPEIKAYLIGYVEKYAGLTSIISANYDDSAEYAVLIPPITKMLNCMAVVNSLLEDDDWFPDEIISALQAIGTA